MSYEKSFILFDRLLRACGKLQKSGRGVIACYVAVQWGRWERSRMIAAGYAE